MGRAGGIDVWKWELLRKGSRDGGMEQGPAVRAGNCSGMELTAGCLQNVKEFRLIKVGEQRKFY